MLKFNQNEHPISGPSTSSTTALLFNLDLKINCFRKFSPVLVVDIWKCDCIFTSLSVLFFLPYSNTDNSQESRDHIVVPSFPTYFCVWTKSLHLTKPQFLHL